MISIVIPTLNEAVLLRPTLRALRESGPEKEVLVVDGGSEDGTREVAASEGVAVLQAPCGRGAQLHEGACQARGDVFWFLHADTLAPPGAGDEILSALADHRVVAGNFRLLFTGRSRGAAFLNVLYPKLAWLGLRYGDSGLWVRRDAYHRSGGFQLLPIFEDLDFIRRVTPLGGWRTLRGPLVTSSRRFESRRFAPVFARWAFLQALYWLGCDPYQLGRLYYPGRAPQRLPGSDAPPRSASRRR